MTTAGQIYQNIAALEPVKRILEEADKALNDRERTIATSDIPEVLGDPRPDACHRARSRSRRQPVRIGVL